MHVLSILQILDLAAPAEKYAEGQEHLSSSEKSPSLRQHCQSQWILKGGTIVCLQHKIVIKFDYCE